MEDKVFKKEVKIGLTEDEVIKQDKIHKMKFPGCIGLFPECKEVKADKPSHECKKCPHFR